jgi:hypothetical protein
MSDVDALERSTTNHRSEAGMTTTTAKRRDGTLYGHAAERVDLTCPHGSSTFFVLPGRDPKANLAAVELLWVRHATRHRCRCGSASPGAHVS